MGATNSTIVEEHCQEEQASFSSTQLDAHWYNVTATSALVYGVITLLLNLRVYTVLIGNRKKKEFSSSFFVVFIIASVLVSQRDFLE